MLRKLKEAVKSVCPEVVLSAYRDIKHVLHMHRINYLNRHQVEMRRGAYY